MSSRSAQLNPGVRKYSTAIALMRRAPNKHHRELSVRLRISDDVQTLPRTFWPWTPARLLLTKRTYSQARYIIQREVNGQTGTLIPLLLTASHLGRLKSMFSITRSICHRRSGENPRTEKLMLYPRYYTSLGIKSPILGWATRWPVCHLAYAGAA